MISLNLVIKNCDDILHKGITLYTPKVLEKYYVLLEFLACTI